jgi:hypothetical protein
MLFKGNRAAFVGRGTFASPLERRMPFRRVLSTTPPKWHSALRCANKKGAHLSTHPAKLNGIAAYLRSARRLKPKPSKPPKASRTNPEGSGTASNSAPKLMAGTFVFSSILQEVPLYSQ